MIRNNIARLARAGGVSAAILLSTADHAAGQFFNLGAEEYVQALGADLTVTGYSVPSFVHWDGDGLKDLVVGEGSGVYPAKVRVYLNVGTAAEPAFDDFTFVQSEGADLVLLGSGCLGCFPRVVYWDADGRKDLLVGLSDGTVMIFLNVGTDEDPTFDGGTLLQVGQPGYKINIDIGSRATPVVVDWNSDGRKDLVAGSVDGKVRIFINEGTDTEPDFLTMAFAQNAGIDLLVPTYRSSPHIADYNGDGMKDLLTGNTEGQILCYLNVNSDEDPLFDGYTYIESEGQPINAPGTPRSRPFVADWNDDGLDDLMFGSLYAKVHLFRNAPLPGDVNGDWIVDAVDLQLLLAAWGDCPAPPDPCPADFNDDGVVNVLDLLILLAGWS